MAEETFEFADEPTDLLSEWGPVQLEDYKELDAAITSVSEGPLADAEYFSGNSLVDWLIKHGHAADRPAAIVLGQRLFDADLIYETAYHKGPGFHDTQRHHFKISLDASSRSDAPKYSLADFYHLKRDSSALSGEMLYRGKYRYNAVWAVISRRDRALYVFRAKETPKPRRAVQLKNVRHIGVRTDDEDGDGFARENDLPCLTLEYEKRELVFRLKTWDHAQKWLEELTNPRVGISSIPGVSLRAQRRDMMGQLQNHPLVAKLKKGFKAVLEETKNKIRRASGKFVAYDPVAETDEDRERKQEEERLAEEKAGQAADALQQMQQERLQAFLSQQQQSPSANGDAPGGPLSGNSGELARIPTLSPAELGSANIMGGFVASASQENVARLTPSVKAEPMMAMLVSPRSALERLSLQEVLDTPQYSFVLNKYMEKNFCDENLRFLEAVGAYRRLFHTIEGQGAGLNSARSLASPTPAPANPSSATPSPLPSPPNDNHDPPSVSSSSVGPSTSVSADPAGTHHSKHQYCEPDSPEDSPDEDSPTVTTNPGARSSDLYIPTMSPSITDDPQPQTPPHSKRFGRQIRVPISEERDDVVPILSIQGATPTRRRTSGMHGRTISSDSTNTLSNIPIPTVPAPLPPVPTRVTTADPLFAGSLSPPLDAASPPAMLPRQASEPPPTVEKGTHRPTPSRVMKAASVFVSSGGSVFIQPLNGPSNSNNNSLIHALPASALSAINVSNRMYGHLGHRRKSSRGSFSGLPGALPISVDATSANALLSEDSLLAATFGNPDVIDTRPEDDEEASPLPPPKRPPPRRPSALTSTRGSTSDSPPSVTESKEKDPAPGARRGSISQSSHSSLPSPSDMSGAPSPANAQRSVSSTGGHQFFEDTPPPAPTKKPPPRPSVLSRRGSADSTSISMFSSRSPSVSPAPASPSQTGSVSLSSTTAAAPTGQRLLNLPTASVASSDRALTSRSECCSPMALPTSSPSPALSASHPPSIIAPVPSDTTPLQVVTLDSEAALYEVPRAVRAVSEAPPPPPPRPSIGRESLHRLTRVASSSIISPSNSSKPPLPPRPRNSTVSSIPPPPPPRPSRMSGTFKSPSYVSFLSEDSGPPEAARQNSSRVRFNIAEDASADFPIQSRDSSRSFSGFDEQLPDEAARTRTKVMNQRKKFVKLLDQPDFMDENERKMKIRFAALEIYRQYVSPSAPQNVNLDSATARTVTDALKRVLPINSADVESALEQLDDSAPIPSSDLFDGASKVIYNMVDRDVYRRFLTTPECFDMVQNPGAHEAEALRGHRKNQHSFAMLALEENYENLEQIARSFASTCPEVKSRRYHFKKYKQCFKGATLVDWLLSNGYAKSRAAAVAFGQRMQDANLLVHITREHDFEDTTVLFYTLEDRSHNSGPSVQLLMHEFANNGRIYSATVLFKGVRYNRVFLVLTIQQPQVSSHSVLYVFRSRVALQPLNVVRLKDARCAVTVSHANPKVSYLQLESTRPVRLLTFRLESESERQMWVRALLEAGVGLRHWTVGEPGKSINQRRLSF